MRNILLRDNLLLAVLDLEASGFGADSYPIEVGVAVVRGATQPIGTWSSLIQPTRQWRAEGLWSPASAAVHNIPRDALDREGRPVHEVCDWLNATLGRGAIVATDAPRYDQDWLDTLFRAAGREQLFTLYEFDSLTSSLDVEQYRQMVHLLDRGRVPHRAGPDALRLAAVLLEAHLGYPPQIEDLNLKGKI